MPARPKRRAARARRVRNRQSASSPTQVKLSPRTVSKMIAGRRVIFPTLPNEHDNAVIRRLSTAGLGDLPTDQFGRLLRKEGHSNDRQSILALRLALIRVCFDAADARQHARAAEKDVASARVALGSLTAAISRLGEVRPKRQRGLAGLFGSPLDDTKGSDELNEFGSRCWQIQLDLVPIAQALNLLIGAETAKSKTGKAGERKKRLRILVEGSRTGGRPKPKCRSLLTCGQKDLIIGQLLYLADAACLSTLHKRCYVKSMNSPPRK